MTMQMIQGVSSMADGQQPWLALASPNLFHPGAEVLQGEGHQNGDSMKAPIKIELTMNGRQTSPI
jgi:hypothetical protein